MIHRMLRTGWVYACFFLGWSLVADLRAQQPTPAAGAAPAPIVVSLAGDVEVEEASEYLFDHKIPAYPYSTEIPVDVLGAKYRWARGAGLL